MTSSPRPSKVRLLRPGGCITSSRHDTSIHGLYVAGKEMDGYLIFCLVACTFRYPVILLYLLVYTSIQQCRLQGKKLALPFRDHKLD